MNKANGSFLLYAAIAFGTVINGAAAQQPAPAGEEQTAPAGQPEASWLIFLDKLRDVSEASPEMMAEAARLEAQRENYYAEQGDYGLELSINHTRYPESSGAQVSDGAFGDLEEYSDARITIDLMHLLARRGSAVDSAKARVDSYQYQLELKASEEAVSLMEDAVTAWTYRYRREALQNALNSVDGAKTKLRLSESAAMPEITKATPTKVAEAIILHSEVKNKLEAISPLIPKIPAFPGDFSVLPVTPPGSNDIYQLASQDLNAQILKAESLAYREEAESLRGNGVSLRLFGGVVEQKTIRQGSEGGPLYGASLTIPLGTNQLHQRRAAEFEAHAAKLGAMAAIRQSQRTLVELRDSWAASIASLNQAQETMRQQAKLLSQLKRRARSPGSGQAPEPWEVDMQEAEFWNAVADVWEKRAEWVQDALTWGLLDPEYLQKHARSPDPQGSFSLCAPYGACSDIAGI